MRMRLKSAGSAAIVVAALCVALALTVGTHRSSLDPRGRVLWKADAQSPLVDEWAEYSTAFHCGRLTTAVRGDPRAKRLAGPTMAGAEVYEFTVSDGDDCYGERSEVGQALPSRADFSHSRLFNDGDDRWISFAVKPGRDFPTTTRHWNVIAQWKQLAVPGQVLCCPILALELRNERYNLASDGEIVWRGPRALRARWARFSLHIKFSPVASIGFVEIWGGDPNVRGMRRLLTRTHMQTLSRTVAGTTVPSHARIGIYRDPTISGTAHLYYDGYTVATTRQAAERNAFGSSTRPWKARSRSAA